MRLGFRLIFVSFLAGIAILALPSSLFSQESGPTLIALAADNIPEAPQPHISVAAAGAQSQQAPAVPSQSSPEPAAAPAPAPSGAAQPPAQDSSSAPTPAPQLDTEKSLHDKAEEQLKQQEKQRVMGIMATFNTTRNKDAVPLSSGQKFKLFFKSSTDPWPFALAAVVSGINEGEDTYPEWGHGPLGYVKRYSAAYSDAFIGNFFGNAVLPSVWHEDPRYFQKGTGSAISRFFWAAGSTVWCKRDNGGWGPNYANVIGNLIGAAISDTYYPPSQRTVANTIENGFTVSAEGIVGAEVIEFWPDLVRHHNRKRAERLAREAARDQSGQTTTQPDSQPAPADTTDKTQK